ncbi:PspC domain-containing protein [Streptomyces sp. NHF165]|uniref:PspC domain-containing protein n=1 Tax=Streptomyces sp. NHF165 TaxID=2175864 RepID=UPI003FCC2EFB
MGGAGGSGGDGGTGGVGGRWGSGAVGEEAFGGGGRKLRRSRSHKVAGGVCGGLGRYFDLDPVIFRVPLAVLSVVGGLGLVFYGFAWLLIPAEGETENEGRRLLSGRVDGASLSAILVALVGCGLFLASLGSRSVPFSVLLIGAVAGAAHWSQRRRQAEAAGAGGAPVDPATAHAVADAPPETKAPPTPQAPSWWRERPSGQGADGDGYLWGPSGAVPGAGTEAAGPARTGRPCARRPRPRPTRQGSLGGLVFLLAVAGCAVGTVVTWEGHTLGTALTFGLGTALAVFGVGLVVSAFVGRVGAGTLVCLVLTAGLLAGAAALPKDISTRFREAHWAPAAAGEVKPHYRLGSGSGELDLRKLELKKGQKLHSSLRVGAGQLKVVVPDDANVRVRADVGAGDARFPTGLDGDGQVAFESSSGFDQSREMMLRPFDGAPSKGTVVLDLSVGLGRAEIVRELPSGERSDLESVVPDSDQPGRRGTEPGPGTSGAGERDGDGEQPAGEDSAR